ncbi:hypothetical protein BV898_19454 [Hypsibius exemplaris]|uniref:Ubiquitin-like protease family profile domain-containing protein n=1 Tax=Hypsibius exemplaris TaxID=2072580 RepID=A0A9X6RNY8_HYPEX|nr:hypothetical protein BV898_19454 [Hypsibius exemplaris]
MPDSFWRHRFPSNVFVFVLKTNYTMAQMVVLSAQDGSVEDSADSRCSAESSHPDQPSDESTNSSAMSPTIAMKAPSSHPSSFPRAVTIQGTGMRTAPIPERQPRSTQNIGKRSAVSPRSPSRKKLLPSFPGPLVRPQFTATRNYAEQPVVLHFGLPHAISGGRFQASSVLITDSTAAPLPANRDAGSFPLSQFQLKNSAQVSMVSDFNERWLNSFPCQVQGLSDAQNCSLSHPNSGELSQDLRTRRSPMSPSTVSSSEKLAEELADASCVVEPAPEGTRQYRLVKRVCNRNAIYQCEMQGLSCPGEFLDTRVLSAICTLARNAIESQPKYSNYHGMLDSYWVARCNPRYKVCEAVRDAVRAGKTVVQPCFDGWNHFVTVVSHGRDGHVVRLLDSMDGLPTPNLLLQIWALFNVDNRPMRVELPRCLQQATGPNNCLVYAAAFALDTLDGLALTDANYGPEGEFRSWIKRMLDDEKLLPTPRKETGRGQKLTEKEVDSLIITAEQAEKIRFDLNILVAVIEETADGLPFL